jgi:hypothetical protein
MDPEVNSRPAEEAEEAEDPDLDPEHRAVLD